MNNSLSHSNLIYLFVDGEATPAERTKLYEALSNNPELQTEFEDAMRLKAAVEKEVQNAVPPIALTEELFLRAGIAIPLAATTAVAPAIPAISNISTWLPMLKAFVIPALAVTGVVTVGVIKLTENNDVVTPPQAIVRTVEQVPQHQLTLTDQATPVEMPKATLRQADATKQASIKDIAPSTKNNSSSNSNTTVAKQPSSQSSNHSTIDAVKSVAVLTPKQHNNSHSQNTQILKTKENNSIKSSQSNDIAVNKTNKKTIAHDPIVQSHTNDPNDKAVPNDAPVATTQIEQESIIIPTTAVQPTKDIVAQNIVMSSSATNMIRLHPSDRISEFGTETPTRISFSIERTVTPLFLQTREGDVPQLSTAFNNTTLGVWYELSAHSQVGAVGGQESFPFFLVNSNGSLSPEGALIWAGLSYRANSSPIEVIGGIQVTARAVAGYSQIGPVTKLSVGLEYAPIYNLSITAGPEFTGLIYQTQGNTNFAEKIALSVGTHFTF